MNLVFLGGAESIGGSSLALELEGRRWVIDCGVRMKGSGDERVPDLAPLEALGAPTAVLVTHAHLDHIGALPVLHQRYPLTPVYATPPTIALTRVQLLDSLRIMEQEAGVEGELPLYSEAAVESTLSKMIPVAPLRPFRPDAAGPEVTFFPAGHIIGASALGIASGEGNIFVSGDVSVDNQRTIPGMRAPRFRADVAVFESTYGNRIHPPRAAEEKRLIETVVSTIEAGGKVLIPAFAIGRAQEVILILLRSQLLGEVPRFPIWVDGMVRRTCAIYAAHPRYLQSTLRKRVEKHGDPFFGVLDTVRPVTSREERIRALEGEPAVIVSSSGMLRGGPSPFYAAALAGDPENLIAITGYQDEEAPGRDLIDVAAGRKETLRLEGREVTPRCRVTTYALSGHASGAQIASIAHAVKAADVFLVHGDGPARRDLSTLFLRERLGRIHLPSDGAAVAPVGRGGRREGSARTPSRLRRLKSRGILGRRSDATLTAESLGTLADHVLETYGPRASFTASEIHAIAFGAEPAEPSETEAFEDALRSSERFASHPVRLFELTALETAQDEQAEGGGGFERLSRRIDEVLPEGAGLIKKSYQPGTTHVTLVFDFPDVAMERHRAALEEAFRDSGWTFDVHPVANPAALDRAARESIPDAGRLAKGPSLHLGDRLVVLHLDAALAEDDESIWKEAARSFRERTGFAIEIREHRSTAAAKESRDRLGRLEVNLAYRVIRDSFAAERHRPYRVGKKAGRPGEPDFIELSFISPIVGERYREKLESISEEIGWPLEISKKPNMAAILDVARGVLEDLPIRKGPSFQPGEGKVVVSLAERAPDGSWRELRDRFRDATGCDLESKT